MGIHGNSTCSLSLGGKGKCKGFLLGEENKGMRAMFVMMNEARLLVGSQALSCASSSYMNAIDYARQRVQGKNLMQMMDKNAPSVPIVQHPDIRRQLLTMKMYVEGIRSLLYYIGRNIDLVDITDDEEEKTKLQGIADVLIPIAKGYVSDRCFDVCNHGVQIFGGYGYIKEYPQEQLVRDCRITMIYEGTNGIQAMDLLGRKLGMNGGKPIMDLMAEMQTTIAEAKNASGLEDCAVKFESAMNRLGEVAMQIGAAAMSPKVMNAFASASLFMDTAGDLVMAWMLLWRASIAAAKLAKGAKKKDKAFYEGQIKSAEYFCDSVLPVTIGKMEATMNLSGAPIEIEDASFGG